MAICLPRFFRKEAAELGRAWPDMAAFGGKWLGLARFGSDWQGTDEERAA